jgi:hypothetical protein
MRSSWVPETQIALLPLSILFEDPSGKGRCRLTTTADYPSADVIRFWDVVPGSAAPSPSCKSHSFWSSRATHRSAVRHALRLVSNEARLAIGQLLEAIWSDTSAKIDVGSGWLAEAASKRLREQGSGVLGCLESTSKWIVFTFAPHA